MRPRSTGSSSSRAARRELDRAGAALNPDTNKQIAGKAHETRKHLVGSRRNRHVADGLIACQRRRPALGLRSGAGQRPADPRSGSQPQGTARSTSAGTGGVAAADFRHRQPRPQLERWRFGQHHLSRWGSDAVRSAAFQRAHRHQGLGHQPAPERVFLGQLGRTAIRQQHGCPGGSRLPRAAAVAGAARRAAIFRRAECAGYRQVTGSCA